MPAAKPEDLPFCAAEVAAEIRRWLGHLGAERRMSAKTCEAYRRDVHQFLAFLAEHLGQRVTLSGLSRLAPADVRAFMAARRALGIGGRSLMRGLAGARSFARFLEREARDDRPLGASRRVRVVPRAGRGARVRLRLLRPARALELPRRRAAPRGRNRPRRSLLLTRSAAAR